ncbi:MAG: quinone-dependent dihydroorotate dehydrogenase [Proteobacteria bacterium]|nr:MAG: quinone-dependent dihydroorotate dehydrogenase [Pseudomonadota bacterium]
MTMYELARSLLFRLDAETSHDIVMRTMSLAARHEALTRRLQRSYGSKVPAAPVEAMGLHFRNPVGLAAGLDKHAAAGPAFCALGFGFVELGTVTPEAQPGNPKPRMFRVATDRAIINRMGFNSPGLDAFLRNLRRARPGCVTGINIGKNAATPIARALDDYRMCLRAVYEDADYVTVNISSPNTSGLRTLQDSSGLHVLLAGLRQCRHELFDQTGRHVPIAVKIAPDLDEAQIDVIAKSCQRHRMDAIIATNTTVSRPAGFDPRFAGETGGLSGEPLRDMSTAVVAALCRRLDGALPVIAAGGVSSGRDAVEKLDAGARLVQLYTGLIYRGPGLVREVAESIAAR